MKELFSLTLILFSFQLNAATFFSFSEGKIYSGDGRWYKNGDTFLFRLNEGNANEENIVFEKNPQSLEHSVKYKLCFKIKKDCHLNCKAEIVKNVALLKPWEDLQPWTPSPNGAYTPAQDKECK